MKKTTLNTEKFMEWYEDTFSTDFAYAIVSNIVDYAKKHAGPLDVTSFLCGMFQWKGES